MKSAFRSKHADRVVLVRSDDSGLATGRRLASRRRNRLYGGSVW